MRQTYVVTYDVSNPKRLEKTFKLLPGIGDHLQLSVCRCELGDRELVELQGCLRDVINQRDDQVLFVDVGPAEGRAETAIESLGRAHSHPERHATVV